MKKIDSKRPVCERCKSGYVYITKKKIVCRRCGYEAPVQKTGAR
jgi:uncharacterized Zn ribbon protein